MKNLGFAAALLTALVPLRTAVAQVSSGTCPTGNLLAKGKVTASLDVTGFIGLVSDDAVVSEGTVWDTPQAIKLATNAGSITWDLGAVYPIRAVLLQGDANDTYSFKVSEDGQSFHEVWALPTMVHVGHGMRTRSTLLQGVTARYVRIGEPTGDEFYSISELQVLCDVPSPWPPPLRTVEGTPAQAPTFTPQTFIESLWFAVAGTLSLTLDQSDFLKMMLSLLGAALLFLGLAGKRHQGAGPRPLSELPFYRRRGFVVASFTVVSLVTLTLAAMTPLVRDILIRWSNEPLSQHRPDDVVRVTRFGMVFFGLGMPSLGTLGVLLWLAWTGPFYGVGAAAGRRLGVTFRLLVLLAPFAGLLVDREHIHYWFAVPAAVIAGISLLVDLLARPKPDPVPVALLVEYRRSVLALLGVIGFFGYFNWGGYHFPVRIHHYEFFHYYVGAKYFKELSYTRLYECSSLAESEQGFKRRVELRKIRDLEKNVLVPAKYILDNPGRCKDHFTPERWEQFKTDITYFRGNTGIDTWEKMLHDHGYNPSPVWNLAGSLLANMQPATKEFVGFGTSMFEPKQPLGLGHLDPVIVLLAFLAILWAFGWEVAAVAVLFFACNHPALYFWTGGGFLREDWFAAAMIGCCCIKKRWPAVGGAFLAYSTLLRVFPGGFFIAIALRLGWRLWKERKLDRVGARIVVGAAIATALLVPVSSHVAGGFGAWPAFLENTAKHAGTPLTNHMGLKTVLTFRPTTRQEVAFDGRLDDPFLRYKDLHKATFKRMMPVFLVLVGAFLLLLLRASNRIAEQATPEDDRWWAIAAISFSAIPVATELTCYYFCFMTTAAFLWKEREEIGVGLLVTSGVTQILNFITYYYDVRYTTESVVVLAFIAWAVWRYARVPVGEALADAAGALGRRARTAPMEPVHDKVEPRPPKGGGRNVPRKRRHG